MLSAVLNLYMNIRNANLREQKAERICNVQFVLETFSCLSRYSNCRSIESNRQWNIRPADLLFRVGQQRCIQYTSHRVKRLKIQFYNVLRMGTNINQNSRHFLHQILEIFISKYVGIFRHWLFADSFGFLLRKTVECSLFVICYLFLRSFEFQNHRI